MNKTQHPTVGRQEFPNWRAALKHAKKMREAGQISEKEYRRIEMHATDESGSMEDYVKIRRAQNNH